MPRALSILMILPFLSCSNDAENTDYTNKGKWVEVVSRTDTIFFEVIDNLEILTLNRGTELQDGVSKPKYKSGPYEYNLREDIISMRWLPSSSSDFNEYYFEIDGNSLFIGNFYEAPFGEILEFEKIE